VHLDLIQGRHLASSVFMALSIFWKILTVLIDYAIHTLRSPQDVLTLNISFNLHSICELIYVPKTPFFEQCKFASANTVYSFVCELIRNDNFEYMCFNI
jgi:hypothetical protein